MITEPMKAPREPLVDFATLQFPVLVSDKEDGIRVLTHPVLGPVSRSFKPIPNIHIREHILAAPICLDGEVVLLGSDPTITLGFNDTQSGVMSIQGYPRFEYRVFDSFFRDDHPFLIRSNDARKAVLGFGSPSITLLQQTMCNTPEEVQVCMDSASARGKEGIVVRSLTGRYKSGRATEREGILFKVVTFVREEARIVGFEPLRTNCNVAKEDEFGRTKRSKHEAGMVTQPLLGAFIVENHWGRFNISGFTANQREIYWKEQDTLLWQTLTYKYKPHGTKNVPRNPVFVGFRDSRDLD